MNGCLFSERLILCTVIAKAVIPIIEPELHIEVQEALLCEIVWEKVMQDVTIHTRILILQVYLLETNISDCMKTRYT
jgi:fructose-bisphosphate aldolase class 1